MCGRYAQALRPSQVRDLLREEDLPIDYTPPDEGEGAPRQSYNFAPGYNGVVCRAVQGPHDEAHIQSETNTIPGSLGKQEQSSSTAYQLESMKWGLIPFWTKRDPGYSQIMRTMNCRDDSLSQVGGMWASMKHNKRCIVIAQGFYEWLKTGPKDKLPHYIKRRDGKLLCFAGLWDCVQYEGSEDKLYTYTIITTEANRQMKFIHARMPVVLDPSSKSVRTWLDPKRREWSEELQSLLNPFLGELDIYPVSKEVGKVGNNSSSLIIPLDSIHNKSNIANYFPATTSKDPTMHRTDESETRYNTSSGARDLERKKRVHTFPRPGDSYTAPEEHTTNKRRMTNATHNEGSGLKKSRAETGTPKITKFFGNVD